MNKLFFFVVFTCLVTSITSCKKTNNGHTSNSLTISNIAQFRSTTSSNFRFRLFLDKVATQDVTVAFETQSGTAIANNDFVPKTGTITIPANSKEASIEIEVKGDSTRKDDQAFYVVLSNPTNCTLANTKGEGTIINANGLHFPVVGDGYTSSISYPGYTLAWSDEFNTSLIDGNSWAFEAGNNNGWGNNELQTYTGSTENAFVSSGNLIIEARKPREGSGFTSARMISKNKKTFKFGRIDIRAKLPTGKGIWPALWMLGNNIETVNWPACGEIDILEHLGHEPTKIYGTLHWGSSTAAHAQKGSGLTLASPASQKFHVYSIIWKQDSIKILVDDTEFLQFSKADVAGAYPFNDPFFFIFNIAVGGNWPGSPDNTTVFPQRMVIDYVRVFQ
ncbi:MAG: family 16 glycosylhydrolase [Chitinophagaceae bacterium]|nr:family 16 glycosylhydrolase [Chitinophagaceae bacterium]